MTDEHEHHSYGQVIYSNKVGAFCSYHDEDFEASDMKTVSHGNIVCPPERDLKCKKEGNDCMQEKKDLLVNALNTSSHAREHFTFHFFKPTDAKRHEETRSRLRKDAHALEMSNGFTYPNLKPCKRNHVVKGISYHHDGEHFCGLHASPDVYTARKLNKSTGDASWEIGYSRNHRLCGVDTDRVFTCRKMCDQSWMPNLGCKHANSGANDTGRFQIFDIKGSHGNFRLEPWQGPGRFSKK